MALLDLLGRRWTLRVVWELRQQAPSFRALQARCHDVSSSVLSQRLAELRDAGIAGPGDDGGSALTAEGRARLEALAPMDTWARRWAGRQEPSKTGRRPR